jgi:subtilisin family serine protease
MHSSTNRYRLLEFLMDLEAQTADLKECERQSCPATYDAETYAAYLTDDMAPRACLDNEQTKAIGTAEDLPESCRGSLLEQRVLQCEDSNCAGTADVAVAGIAAAACRGDGVPIAEFIAELDLERWFSYPASACNLPSSPVPGVEIGVMRNSQDLLSGDPEDPFYLSSGAMEPALPDQWGTRRIGSYDALADDERYPVTAARTIVAVIDSGVDIHHPDLRGMLWVNPGELPGNGFDDDGNGFVDDRHGWNFVQNNADVQDNNGHGTMVAGIIAAEPYNGIGIAGVNPWAKIMAIKVTNFRGNGNSVDIAAAITYAVNEGARVINVSLGGGGFSEVEQAAVRYAESKGVLVVVAAGNQGTDASRFWPAGLGNVVTVAATEPGDARASYSNWGSPVDVAAPGSSMLSLRARGTDLMYFVEDDYPYGRNIVGQDRLLYYASGTSFAAPLVSGAASLVLSMHAGLGADEVRRMLLHAATDIETPGVDALTGYGLVDARAALAADPAYFTEAAITGVRSVRREGALLVEVIGTADADRFASAQIDFGEGNAPEDWTTVGEPMLTPVRDGVLAGIDAARLRGSPQWTLRVVTRHEDGSRREARFALTLQ